METDAFFRDGDRWVAMGDSITESGRYMAWVEYFLRCRNGRLSFRNAGVGGDTTAGAARRLAEEFARGRPTSVSFFFGMNDINRSLFTPDANPALIKKETASCRTAFAVRLDELVTRAQAEGARVVVFSPPPFEHHPGAGAPDLPGVDRVLGVLAAKAEEIAARRGIPFVDIHGGMTAWTLRLRRSAAGGSLIDPDRVHPGALGQLVIGVLAFEALAPRFAHGTCTVEGRLQENRGIDFVFPSAGLPIVFPEDTGAPEDFLSSLRARLPREILQVRGLPAGRYALWAGGANCGTYSHAELESGLETALMAEFPATKTSKALRALLERLTNLQWEFRQIAWCEFMASEKLPGVSAPADVVRILRELQAERPYLRVPIEQRLENYPRLKADEKGLLHRIESLEKEIDAFALPKDIPCVLHRED